MYDTIETKKLDFRGNGVVLKYDKISRGWNREETKLAAIIPQVQGKKHGNQLIFGGDTYMIQPYKEGEALPIYADYYKDSGNPRMITIKREGNNSDTVFFDTTRGEIVVDSQGTSITASLGDGKIKRVKNDGIEVVCDENGKMSGLCIYNNGEKRTVTCNSPENTPVDNAKIKVSELSLKTATQKFGNIYKEIEDYIALGHKISQLGKNKGFENLSHTDLALSGTNTGSSYQYSAQRSTVSM